MPEAEPRNIIEKFFTSVGNILEAPTIWVREKVVKPNQQNYPWYHQKFRRVPSIDECYTDDVVCQYEANFQYKRDKQVDSEILSILRERFEDCAMYEAPDHIEKCTPLLKQYEEAATNWFIKYGDMGAYHDAKTCYMKQKHRLIWERRHGPVGSGIKSQVSEENPGMSGNSGFQKGWNSVLVVGNLLQTKGHLKLLLDIISIQSGLELSRQTQGHIPQICITHIYCEGKANPLWTAINRTTCHQLPTRDRYY